MALRAADAEAAAIVREGELDAAKIREAGSGRVADAVAAVIDRMLEGTG